MNRVTPLSRGLKKLAAVRNVSNAELARQCGIAERTFGGYCIGKRAPEYETLLRMCSRLGVTPNDLLLEKDGDLSEREELIRRLTNSFSVLSVVDLKVALAMLEAITVVRSADSAT